LIDSVALKQFNYGHFTAAEVVTFGQTGGHTHANPLHGRKHHHSNTLRIQIITLSYLLSLRIHFYEYRSQRWVHERWRILQSEARSRG